MNRAWPNAVRGAAVRGRVVRLLGPMLVVALAAGCSGGGTRAASGRGAVGSGAVGSGAVGSGAVASVESGGAATAPDAVATEPVPADCARRTLAGLSDRQRAGQLFIVGIPTTGGPATAAGFTAARSALAGGYLLFGGTSAPLPSVRALTDRLSAGLAAVAGGVRPYVAVDQEGGQVQPLSGVGFSPIPSAFVQGTWPVARLRQAWTAWGGQLRQAGINVDFAPVVDVVPASLGAANQPIGRYDRQYGHGVLIVSDHAAAAAEGLAAAGVAATAKHFPGLGRVVGNTDVTAGVSDPVTGPGDATLQPYFALVRSGVRFVMVSTAAYPRFDPGRLAAFSPSTMSLLRNTFGFTGLIVSDDLGAARQVSGIPPERRALDFLAAGGQVVLVVKPPAVVQRMVDAVVTRMGADAPTRERVDAAVLAVLTEKARAGMITC